MIVKGEEALWWTIVTMTTVGYGDYVPTTTSGRLLAVVLMFLGVGLFGVLTSFLAATFATPAHEARKEEFAEIRKQLAEIKQMLREDSGLPPNEDDSP
jgi:voltage-gated potassium channel